MVFDFEWINTNLFAGLYTRTKSFIDDSIFMSTGRPASLAERALLKPFPGAVRPDILEGLWRPPKTDGSGHDRIWPRRALTLLASAGYRVTDGKLTRDGTPLSFEIMVEDRAQERLAPRLCGFADAHRRRHADTHCRRGAIPAPPAEFRFRHDARFLGRLGLARQRGTHALGLGCCGRTRLLQPRRGQNPPPSMRWSMPCLRAESEEDFVTAVRALDRVLLSGFLHRAAVPFAKSVDCGLDYACQTRRNCLLTVLLVLMRRSIPGGGKRRERCAVRRSPERPARRSRALQPRHIGVGEPRGCGPPPLLSPIASTPCPSVLSPRRSRRWRAFSRIAACSPASASCSSAAPRPMSRLQPSPPCAAASSRRWRRSISMLRHWQPMPKPRARRRSPDPPPMAISRRSKPVCRPQPPCPRFVSSPISAPRTMTGRSASAPGAILQYAAQHPDLGLERGKPPAGRAAAAYHPTIDIGRGRCCTGRRH